MTDIYGRVKAGQSKPVANLKLPGEKKEL